ncbi:MAG TPA: class I SAM-dependent methyltransferase [Solirubrobacteraceae bacterium]|nr:class I SAM-dependent methyltransferase [Solirubrobacteraceae bacterium]
MTGRVGRLLSARRRLRTVTLSPRRRFEQREPSAQTAIDAVPGLWASRLPAPLADVRAGDAPLFDDERIRWAFDRIGGVDGRSVLELGPLEGGHSYMAHEGGAARVVAVEANREAFLKCLVTKELLGLERCSFRCGDVVAYLEATTEEFDVCVASGILYHLAEPVRLLELISARARRLVLWTHVYDAEGVAAAGLERRFSPPRRVEHAGFAHTVHRHRYGLGRSLSGFWGGTRPYSCWLGRDDLLGALRHFGWSDVETAFEGEHPYAPALALVASR